jgi:hypothetical protein
MNTEETRKILNFIEDCQMDKIPQEYLTEKNFTQKINSQETTLLHKCAQFSHNRSFTQLPPQILQEKNLLIENMFGENVIFAAIINKHADEIPPEILKNNLEVTNLEGTSILEKLIKTRYDIPQDWLTEEVFVGLLHRANKYEQSILHLLAEYQPQKIPKFITQKQLLNSNNTGHTPLDKMIYKENLKDLNKNLLAKLTFRDLIASNNKYRQTYTQEELKDLHVDAIKCTIKQQLIRKNTK